MTRTQLRNGFTMIEVVMVIVILGIVSSIGAEIIARVYESYIVQRAQYRAATKTELALNQIANRLRYAIPSTVGARADLGATFEPIVSVVSPNRRVLQWVGYDGDSLESRSAASSRPGWSGFCDVDAYMPGTTALPTPGSDMGLTSQIIGNLGGSIGNAVIYFPDTSAGPYGISGGAGESITLDAAIPSGERIYERYKLAWSSYALEVDVNNDLILHYGFTPITGAVIAGGKKSWLLRNVTNFRFKGTEGSLRIKICKKERISMYGNITVHACKEKVIF